MNYTIITSFNQKYWDEIARDNILQLDQEWPENNNIILYHQLSEIPRDQFSDKIEWIDLYQKCPELPVFAEKYKDEHKANGVNGNNFRLNAIKFCHKTFAIWHQAKVKKSGWLIWLDCDAFVYKKIDHNFLKMICPDTYMISYMGRPGKYSECGFVGFNLSHPETLKFILEWEDLYLSGKFLELPETHDSWTFDWLRKQKDQSLFFNVNANAVTNKNPFSQSLLGTHIAHAKGDKKQQQTNRLKSRLS
jgi:hypothetical protein